MIKSLEQYQHMNQHDNKIQQENNSLIQFNGFKISIKFDQEYPIELQNVVISFRNNVSILKTQKIQSQKQHHQNQNQNHNHSNTKKSSYSLFISSKPSNPTQNSQNFPTLLQIPFSNILCIGKKSNKTTLIILKDQQKQIQFDQNGYQLESDSDQEEDYEESKKNGLYQRIKEAINNNQIKKENNNSNLIVEQKDECKQNQNQYANNRCRIIKLDKKCNIQLTSYQTTTTTNPTNPPIQQTTNKLSKQQQNLKIYNFLSLKLQQYEKQINYQNNNNQNCMINPMIFSLKNNNQFFMPQGGQQENQGQQFDDDDYNQEDYQEEDMKNQQYFQGHNQNGVNK